MKDELKEVKDELLKSNHDCAKWKKKALDFASLQKPADVRSKMKIDHRHSFHASAYNIKSHKVLP